MMLLEVMSDGSQECNQEELMDLGIAEEYAHRLADDRKWDDVKVLAAGDCTNLCNRFWYGTEISEVIQGSTKRLRRCKRRRRH